jgi:putative ABC transport system substrate-binding protein
LLIAGERREGYSIRHVPEIAIVQHSSTPVLDDSVAGMVAGLAERGLRDGETAIVRRYNAEGDLAVANAMAQDITTGGTDVVITSSTPSLQAVAKANRAGRVKHVFAIVTDPYATGLDLDPADPLHHPRHVVGQSTLVPIGEAFRLVKRSYPELRRVGTAWNPGEANARRFVELARGICRDLAIELIETSVESGALVREAVDSLAARGAEILWIGGDGVMLSSIDTAVAAARRSRIPVFTIAPGRPDRGTFLDFGVDYHEVGRLAGRLAGDIARGADPAGIPVTDVGTAVPHVLVINTRVLHELGVSWQIPPDVLASASVIVDRTGVHHATPARQPAPND